MQFGPMLAFLPGGKHFRRPSWPAGQYLFMEEGHYKIKMPGGMTKDLIARQEELAAGDWETC